MTFLCWTLTPAARTAIENSNRIAAIREFRAQRVTTPTGLVVSPTLKAANEIIKGFISCPFLMDFPVAIDADSCRIVG